MAKLDLSSAYRRVPAHRTTHVCWRLNGRGPLILTRHCHLGSLLGAQDHYGSCRWPHWAMKCTAVKDFIHYLDNFSFCLPALSQACQEALLISVPLFADLGLPTATNKLEGPARTFTFLGIEIDSVKQEFRLAQRKLTRL